MLMVEHELGAVERVCESVIVMAQGKILANGSMGELRRRTKRSSMHTSSDKRKGTIT